MGFIGYAVRRDKCSGAALVRIFINCEQKPDAPERTASPSHDPEDLSPPEDIVFLHQVDVLFEEGRCQLRGLDNLSAVRKFSRLLSAFGERAREIGHDPNWVFESAENLLETLALIKNSKEFGPAFPSNQS